MALHDLNSVDWAIELLIKQTMKQSGVMRKASKIGHTMNSYPHFIGICIINKGDPDQGPVVQNMVGLTSSLVVKMLTVLVSTISNSQLFLLKKCE